MKWGINIALPLAGILITSSSLSANKPLAECPVSLILDDTAYYYNEDGKEIQKIAIRGDARYFVINTRLNSRNIYGDVSGTDTIESDGKVNFRPADVRSIPKRKAREIESLIIAKDINNELVLKNIVEIPSRELIEFMRSKIKDDGRGDTDPLNNIEYGGFIRNSQIVHYTSGYEADPSKLQGATLVMKGDGEFEFHSHPSGSRRKDDCESDCLVEAVTATGSKSRTREQAVSYFVQGPSKEDQLATQNRIGIVFGMKSRRVYIYDAQGVRATLPFSFFENVKREKAPDTGTEVAKNDVRRFSR